MTEKKEVKVKFLVDQYSPEFGDKSKGDVMKIEINQAKILEIRNVVKILKSEKRAKDE